MKRYESEAGKFTIEELLYIIYSLSNAVDFIRKTTLARIPFEAAILKLTQRASMISLDKMLEKVKAAEKSFPANNPAVPDRNDPAAANSPRAPKTDSGDKKPVGEHSADKASDKSATPVKSSDFAEIANSWTIILNYIKTKKISVASYLAEAYPVSLESNILSIGIPKQFQFNKEVLESLENRRLIEEAARVVLGIDIRVTLVSIESANTPRGQTAESAEDEIDSPGEQRDDFVKREAEPIVNAALEIFGGRIAIDKNSKRKE